MKNKKKIKSKIKFLSIVLIVIAIGLVVSSSKIIKVTVDSDTIKTQQEAPSNFINSTSSTKVLLKDIKNNKGKNIILFSSSWCGSCNKLIQDLSQLAHDYPQINIYVMDLENDRDAANELNVPITPTLVLLENGETKNYPEVTIDNLSTIINDFNRIGIR